MRLIDADKFMEQLKSDINEMENLIFIMAAEAITHDLAKQPTVEAIPIEWLENWIKKNCPRWSGYADLEHMDFFGLIKDWRKENER